MNTTPSARDLGLIRAAIHSPAARKIVFAEVRMDLVANPATRACIDFLHDMQLVGFPAIPRELLLHAPAAIGEFLRDTIVCREPLDTSAKTVRLALARVHREGAKAVAHD